MIKAGKTPRCAFGLSLDNKDSFSRRGVPPIYVKHNDPNKRRLVRAIGIHVAVSGEEKVLS